MLAEGDNDRFFLKTTAPSSAAFAFTPPSPWMGCQPGGDSQCYGARQFDFRPPPSHRLRSTGSYRSGVVSQRSRICSPVSTVIPFHLLRKLLVIGYTHAACGPPTRVKQALLFFAWPAPRPCRRSHVAPEPRLPPSSPRVCLHHHRSVA